MEKSLEEEKHPLKVLYLKKISFSVDADASEPNVYRFKDELMMPDLVYDYTDGLRDDHVPLIIDNGEQNPWH